MSAFAPPRAPRLIDPELQTWVELRFAPRPMSIADIVLAVRQRVDIGLTAILGWLDSWSARGLVEQIGRPATYAMVNAAKAMPDPPAPLGTSARTRRWLPTRTPRQRLWSAMRVLKRFDLVTLVMSADVSEKNAKDFLRTMTRAGYLRAVILPTGQGGSTWVQGSRSWGPLHPRVERIRIDGKPYERITDRNDGSIVDVALRPHWQDRQAPHSRGEG